MPVPSTVRYIFLQTLDLNEELQETISQNPMDVGEPALDELEEELNMILQSEGKTVTPHRPMVAPPRRMVSPPSGMRVPHQELVNSLCQMKVLDRSGEYFTGQYVYHVFQVGGGMVCLGAGLLFLVVTRVSISYPVPKG